MITVVAIAQASNPAAMTARNATKAPEKPPGVGFPFGFSNRGCLSVLITPRRVVMTENFLSNKSLDFF
jgi:hypothetical protein